MPPTPTSKLYTDIRPQGSFTDLCRVPYNVMGSDTPRLSDSNFGVDPKTKKSTPPRFAWFKRVQIRERSMVVHNEYEIVPDTPARSQTDTQLANLRSGDFNGYVSPNTARKMRNILKDWRSAISHGHNYKSTQMIENSQYFAFVTLTLPVKQFHTDLYLKQNLLHPFLKRLVTDFQVSHHMWKAEAASNQNIHFHVIIDKYIEKDQLDLWWGAALEQQGYISAYMEQTGSLFPPANNICKIPKGDEVFYYISKYMTKGPKVIRSIMPSPEGRIIHKTIIEISERKDGSYFIYEPRKLDGRVWGCSDALRELKPFNVLVSDRINEFIDHIQSHRGIFTKVIKSVEVFIGSITPKLANFDNWLWRAYYWWHVDQYRFLYSNQTHKPPPKPYDLRQILINCCSEVRDYVPFEPQAEIERIPLPITTTPTKPNRSMDPYLFNPF